MIRDRKKCRLRKPGVSEPFGHAKMAFFDEQQFHAGRDTDVSFIAQTLNIQARTVDLLPRSVMTGHRVGFPSVSKICAHVKRLGFAAARRIRLYGEKFEVVSDPMSSIEWGCSSDDERKINAFAYPRIPVAVFQCEKEKKNGGKH